MKVVRKLLNEEGYTSLKEIYDRGSKIAISCSEDLPLDLLENAIDEDGFRLHAHSGGVKLVEGLYIGKAGTIILSKGSKLVLDEVVVDVAGFIAIVTVKPFLGEYRGYSCIFNLQENEDSICPLIVYEVIV